MQVWHIENLPAELQIMTFHGHVPALAQGHIQTCVPIAADCISGAALTRKRMSEVIVECPGWIGENTDRAIRLPEVSGPRSGDHLCDALLIPVGGPEIT